MHAVKALLKVNAVNTVTVYVQKGRNDSRLRAIIGQAEKAGIAIVEARRSALDELADGLEHQGVLAEFRGQPIGDEKALLAHLGSAGANGIVLVLDGLQDPHNLGACLRSADAAGVIAVVIPTDNSVGITPVVRKVASGAADTVPIYQVVNLQRSLAKLKEVGCWVYGAAGEAEQSLYALDLTGPVAIVMGSEGNGLRRLSREACDVLFSIPMHGTVESLNVSVATGITLFEACRQRAG